MFQAFKKLSEEVEKYNIHLLISFWKGWPVQLAYAVQLGIL